MIDDLRKANVNSDLKVNIAQTEEYELGRKANRAFWYFSRWHTQASNVGIHVNIFDGIII